MDIKRAFIDVETGGFDSVKNGLIQVAGIIDINGKVEEEFNYKMRPVKGKSYEQQALQVNNFSMEMLNSFERSEKCFHLFRQTLKNYVDPYNTKDKFNFIGYNVTFDNGFIRQWFKDNNDDYFGSLFFRYSIDVASHAMEALIDIRHEMKNDRLGTVMEYFDVVPEGDLHDAMVDIKATREVYYKALKKLRGADQQSLFNDEVEF